MIELPLGESWISVLQILVKHVLHFLIVGHFNALYVVEKTNLILKVLLEVFLGVSLVLLLITFAAGDSSVTRLQ